LYVSVGRGQDISEELLGTKVPAETVSNLNKRLLVGSAR